MSTQLSYSLRPLLEKEKLARNGANFLDWHRNLRLALRLEKKEYLLTTPLPAAPAEGAAADKKEEYDKHIKDEKSINVLIVAVMEPELQKEFMDCGLSVMQIIDRLKNMFQEKSLVEKAKLIKAIANTRLAEGKEVGPHVMKIASYFRQLEKLEVTFTPGVAQDFILNSLPSSYSGFVVNYRMQGMEKSLDEFQEMLSTVEEDLKRDKDTRDVLVVNDKKVKKKTRRPKKDNGKVKPQAMGAPDGSNEKRDHATFEIVCYYCVSKGH